jgi:hypothetical protein
MKQLGEVTAGRHKKSQEKASCPVNHQRCYPTQEVRNMENTIPKGLRITFLAGCITAGIFGFIYVLIPEAYKNMIGAPIRQPAELTVTREFGVSFLALAFAGWLASRETAVDAVKITAKMAIFWMVLGALVMLWCLLSTTVPAIFWGYFILFAGFAIAFSAFYPRG